VPASSTGNVFITGAAAGIGAAATRLLAEAGYTVFAGVHKDTGSLDRLPGVRQVPLDVTDPDSVAAAAASVASMVGDQGLRALINNAGIIIQGPIELIRPQDLERQFAVNTLGPAYAIQAFASLLRVGRGRVINISAPTARVHVPFLSALVGSKAALEAMSDAIRLELDVWGVPVVVIEPGATGTRIFAKADEVAQAGLAAIDPGQVELYQARLDAVAKASAAQRTRPPESVAATILAAVQARTPKRRYTTGQDARMAGLLTALPAGLRERILRGFLGLSASAAGS
jgi:NAD(P)-dependent dehydrogenase (short-subunit alcohol dehydrogenase family)